MSSKIRHRAHRKTLSFSAFVASALFCAPAMACDVALVLAIDVSGSVDAKEYRLQADGLSDALGDPIVSEALVNAQALVAVVQWSGIERQELSVPWTATDTHEDVLQLRAAIEAAPRPFRNYSTGIGDALEVAINLHNNAPRRCRRKVIDVSGDGPSNEGVEPKAVRARLDAAEITVNGLAIEGSEDGIADYYRDHVAHGPGAFVEVAKDYKDFPRAIRKKLLLELADRLSRAPRLRTPSPRGQRVRGDVFIVTKRPETRTLVSGDASEDARGSSQRPFRSMTTAIRAVER